MFAWRKSIESYKEPANTIVINGYGWYNATEKPWETPGQMPLMGYFGTLKFSNILY